MECITNWSPTLFRHSPRPGRERDSTKTSLQFLSTIILNERDHSITPFSPFSGAYLGLGRLSCIVWWGTSSLYTRIAASRARRVLGYLYFPNLPLEIHWILDCCGATVVVLFAELCYFRVSRAAGSLSPVPCPGSVGSRETLCTVSGPVAPFTHMTLLSKKHNGVCHKFYIFSSR